MVFILNKRFKNNLQWLKKSIKNQNLWNLGKSYNWIWIQLIGIKLPNNKLKCIINGKVNFRESKNNNKLVHLILKRQKLLFIKMKMLRLKPILTKNWRCILWFLYSDLWLIVVLVKKECMLIGTAKELIFQNQSSLRDFIKDFFGLKNMNFHWIRYSMDSLKWWLMMWQKSKTQHPLFWD